MRSVTVRCHLKWHAAVIGAAMQLGRFGGAFPSTIGPYRRGHRCPGTSETGTVTDLQDQILYRLISPGENGSPAGVRLRISDRTAP